MDVSSPHGRGRDGRARLRRWVALSALLLAATLTACSDQGPTINAGQSASTSTSTSVAETSELRVVTYRGIELRVPASWPIHELVDEPERCVRFDEHAVFLGSPGADPQCPSRVVGRTETIQVQPRSGATRAAEVAATSPATINGVSVLLDPNADAAGAHTAVVTDLDLVVTVTFGDDKATADRILQSLHAT